MCVNIDNAVNVRDISIFTSLLSGTLGQDILIATPLFNKCSTDCLSMVALRLKTWIALPSDVIVEQVSPSPPTYQSTNRFNFHSFAC
jgi:hypothetical protein